jgi:hypothetical protein
MLLSQVRHMLAEIYGWFTEGFNTADLRKLQPMLVQLAQKRPVRSTRLRAGSRSPTCGAIAPRNRASIAVSRSASGFGDLDGR